jgi:enterochelin esterase family protein
MPTRSLSFLLLLILTVPVAAQDMPLSQILIDGEGWKPVEGPFKAIRGLCADKDCNVFAIQAADPPLVHIETTGKAKALESIGLGEDVSGLALQQARTLTFLQPKLQMLASFPPGPSILKQTKLGIAGHDLAVAADKGIYCTVPGEGAVYLVNQQDGSKRKVADGITKPTAVVLSADQGTLVVGDAGGKHLYAFRIDKDGSLSAREGYYTLRLPPMQKASGVEGLMVDRDRRLYAATPVGIQVFDPTGRMCGVLLNPARDALPTALALGGADGDLLYAACGDRLFVRKTKAKSVFMAEKPKQ